METGKDRKRKKDVPKNKTLIEPSTTEINAVPRVKTHRRKKAAVEELPPNSPGLGPRRMITRALARRLAQAGEQAELLSLSKWKIKLTPTRQKKKTKIEPDSDSDSSTSEPEPKPKSKSKKQKRNDEGAKETDLLETIAPQQPKKQKLNATKNTKSSKDKIQKTDLPNAGTPALDSQKKSSTSTGQLLAEEAAVNVIEVEVQEEEPIVPLESVGPEIEIQKVKADIMNHMTLVEGEIRSPASPAPGCSTPSFGSKKLKLKSTPLATVFEDEIQESDSDSLGPFTPRLDLNKTYVIQANESEADQSVQFLDDTDVSFGPADNYNITLFHEYDENMTHRKGKEISKWAKSQDFVNEQLFRTQPNLMKILNGRRADNLIFPAVDSRKKLFPGAPKPKN